MSAEGQRTECGMSRLHLHVYDITCLQHIGVGGGVNGT